MPDVEMVARPLVLGGSPGEWRDPAGYDSDDHQGKKVAFKTPVAKKDEAWLRTHHAHLAASGRTSPAATPRGRRFARMDLSSGS